MWSDEAVEAAAAWAHQEQCRRSGTDLPWDVAYESERADYRNIATQMLDAAVRVDGPAYRPNYDSAIGVFLLSNGLLEDRIRAAVDAALVEIGDTT